MSAPAAALHVRLLERCARLQASLAPDELHVWCVLGERILSGQTSHGRLDLRRDARDFAIEAGQELADDIVYRAMDTVRALLLADELCDADDGEDAC